MPGLAVSSLGPFRNDLILPNKVNNGFIGGSPEHIKPISEPLASRGVESFQNYSSARLLPQNVIPIAP